MEQLLNNFNNYTIFDIINTSKFVVFLLLMSIVLTIIVFFLIIDKVSNVVAVLIAIFVACILITSSYKYGETELKKQRLEEIVMHEDSSNIEITDTHIIYEDIVIKHNIDRIFDYVVKMKDGSYKFAD